MNRIDLNAVHNVNRVCLLLRCASTFLTKILDWTGKVVPVPVLCFYKQHYFSGTVESFKVLDKLAEDSVVFHQLHKRVWPSTQRETVFCSHICMLTNAPRPENMVGHTWMVCNFSMEHPSVPVSLYFFVDFQDLHVHCTYSAFKFVIEYMYMYM